MPRLRPIPTRAAAAVTAPKPEEEIEASGEEQTENQEIQASEETSPQIEESASEGEQGLQSQDDTSALKKQVEDLQKSEQILKEREARASRERDEALQRDRQRQAEVDRFRRETVQTQRDHIATALEAAQSLAVSAKNEIKNAIANGDPDAQADALEKLAKARADISRLEDGKTEIEKQLKNPQVENTGGPVDVLDKANMPDPAKAWLRNGRMDYLSNPRKNAKLNNAHYELLEEGHAFGSPEYLDGMEIKMGERQPAPKPQTQSQTQPANNNPPVNVSAPVSREAPSTPNAPRGGSIRLTPDQREAAKVAGVTEAEYAKQLQKLNQMRANGTYGEGR